MKGKDCFISNEIFIIGSVYFFGLDIEKGFLVLVGR